MVEGDIVQVPQHRALRRAPVLGAEPAAPPARAAGTGTVQGTPCPPPTALAPCPPPPPSTHHWLQRWRMLCPGAYCRRPWWQGQALWGTQAPPARYSPGAHSQPLAQSSRQCPSSAAPAAAQLAGQEDTQSEYRCPRPHCRSAGHRGAAQLHPTTSHHIHPTLSQHIPPHPSHHIPPCPTTSHHLHPTVSQIHPTTSHRIPPRPFSGIPLHPSLHVPPCPTASHHVHPTKAPHLQPTHTAKPPNGGLSSEAAALLPPAPQAAEGRRKGSGNGIHLAECGSLCRGAALGKGGVEHRGKHEPSGCTHNPSGCPRAPWVLAAHSRVGGQPGAGDPSSPGTSLPQKPGRRQST